MMSVHYIAENIGYVSLEKFTASDHYFAINLLDF